MQKYRIRIRRAWLVRETIGKVPDPEALSSSACVARLLTPLATEATQELFWTVLLNTKNRPLDIVEVSRGTLNSSLVHPREVFRAAILAGANSIIIGHNHPSGDPAPSAEDRTMTSRLVNAGKLLGIAVLDHVVIGDSQYYSFADDCRLYNAVE